MIQTPDDRRPTITPQLAVRVAILGGIAFALFAIIFFRLWFLQVLSGDQYLAEARNNQVRNVKVEAPRGDIVDRNGTVLVKSRKGTAVQLDPQKVPAAERDLAAAYGAKLSAAERVRVARHAKRIRPVALPALPAGEVALDRLYRRLGRVIGMSARSIHRQVLTQLAMTPYSSVTLKTDVPFTVSSYILERQREFPGVKVLPVFLRSYPHNTLAAQLFGTVGEVSPAELKKSHFRGVGQGTRVGKSGIEYAYDRYLRGDDGATRVQVDSLGRPEGELSVKDPMPGKQLKLSIDVGLQAEGQRAVAKALGLARANGDPATAGGFVAMDPRNGEVLAMGSYPSFDPNLFAKPISQRKYDEIRNAPGDPQYNRALSGLYPTGSTFKPITALASLNKGVITPSTPINDPGCIKIGEQNRCNAGETPFGSVSLVRALQVSSDVFFYTLGRDTNALQGQVIQTVARKLGLGRLTGIDIPGEVRGLVPDAAWRQRIGRQELKCRAKRHVASCGISDARPWTVGDNVNLAVGQGDLQATPLQMAVAYAAIANGGRVVRPHLGLEIEDDTGRVLQKIEPPAARTVKINPVYQAAIMDGLHAAASADGGTSAVVFKGWPQTQYPVFGKTGTAQRPPFKDQSWYVAYVPNKTRPIVVAVTIEQGGWGAQAAAPATRLMLSQWFNVKKKLVEGNSHTR
jgi:penicillin-binding protein 2